MFALSVEAIILPLLAKSFAETGEKFNGMHAKIVEKLLFHRKNRYKMLISQRIIRKF